MISPSPWFEFALKRFEEENSKDPSFVDFEGKKQPRELLHARFLSQWIRKLAPEASEALRLAAHCQHLCRWRIPRSQYEMNRAGYLKWRSDLKKFHAEQAGLILVEVGYDLGMVEKVQALNLKKNFPHDPESQILEDALCLVFLQLQFDEFVGKNEREKVIGVLQKTWKKMSPAGRAEAMKLPLSEKAVELIREALNL